MGNIKYSTIQTSNGDIQFTECSKIHQKNFDNMEYIKIFDVNGNFKVYLNNSKDFIFLKSGQELELKDFQINFLKIEVENIAGISTLQYYLCK